MPRVFPGASAPEPWSDDARQRRQMVSTTPSAEQRALDPGVLPGRTHARQTGDAEETHGARRPTPCLDEATRRIHCRLLADAANAARVREMGHGLTIFHDPRGLALYNNFPIRV